MPTPARISSPWESPIHTYGNKFTLLNYAAVVSWAWNANVLLIFMINFYYSKMVDLQWYAIVTANLQ